MNILICGSDGQLGKSLCHTYNDKFNLIKTNKNEMDITNIESIKKKFDEVNPNIVINTAAFTDVNMAEKKINECYLVNSIGTKNLSHFSKKSNCLFIHFSTDYVFNGKKSDDYKESDLTDPISIYGKSKLSGEKEIINSGCDYIIIRISWLHSFFEKINFVNKMFELANNKKNIKVVNDQISRPTSSIELSRDIWKIIRKYNNNKIESGVFHYSQEGKTISFYDFANYIYDFMNKKGLNTPLVQSIKTIEFDKQMIRPLNSNLDNNKFKKTFEITINNWKESLDYILEKKIERIRK